VIKQVFGEVLREDNPLRLIDRELGSYGNRGLVVHGHLLRIMFTSVVHNKCYMLFPQEEPAPIDLSTSVRYRT
jgi:hypothetical protein